MSIVSECKYAVVVPCYNEGMTIIKFLTELEQVLNEIKIVFKIIIVNDYSIDNTLDLLKEFCQREHNQQFVLLTLPYNTGHQKSIQQGLLYCHAQLHSDYAIVLDGDGEDDPAAIKDLIHYEGYDYIPVVRGKRNENFIFQSMYRIYKLLFSILVGKVMNFGNYCMIRENMIQNVCDTNYVHLAGFLSKQRCKKTSIVWDRRKRIDGKSKMNFTNLLWHGFRSFVEYAEDFLLFFLRIFGAIIIFFSVLITNVLYKKLVTHEAIPGWASSLTVSLVIGALLCFGFLAIGVILISLSTKNNQSDIRAIYKVV
jgi:glycosyltransferase involved in cell wall biosynthesis